MIVMSDFLKVCEKAVREAGATVQGWIGKTSVRHKGPADLVTEADFAAQEVIRKTVLGAFPDHSLLGEEGEHSGGDPRTEYRWIADPLDGTTNYVHGVPHYAVSLALEQNGRILVGAIYNPPAEECFTAAAGQGARLNGRPIHTSQVARLSDALAATGFPNDVRPDSPDLRVFIEAAFHCQGIRRSGSASLNLCYLAAGRFDVLWAYSTKIWDIAAGILLVSEAGGIVTAADGGPFVLEDPRYLAAATPALHCELRQLAARAMVNSVSRPHSGYMMEK
jgi:myo-inositol-1(or 4)-monophosphatase